MIIEVTGTSTRNKGAELMLAAIKEHFARHSDVSLAVDQYFGSYQDRARYGLLQKVVANRIGRSRLAMELMPSEFRTTIGLVRDEEVDVLMDAAGFAFGDQHPAGRTLSFANRLETARKAGKKIILLPQAFGPFDNQTIRDGFRRIVDAADLVYARDALSFEHVVAAVGDQAKIRRAPDITIGVQGCSTPSHISRENVVVVPNSRMLDKVSAEQARSYIPFLSRCLKAIDSSSLKPILLLHDAKEDHKIVAQLTESLGHEVCVVQEADPRVLKHLIGQARLLIGSRFHSLVAALSSGVPVLAAGWSHKYDMLLEDFASGGMTLSPTDELETIRHKVQDVLDKEEDIVARLKDRKLELKGTLQSMWNQIDGLLGIA